MNPELKSAWIAALRSGAFAQGQGHLEYEGRFCCLGVLCKVAGIPRREEGKNIFYAVSSQTGNWTDALVPNEVCGLEKKILSHLAGLNDNKELSFAEIADWIEEREI